MKQENGPQRLDRALGGLGYGSRREIAEMAKRGGILVNGGRCVDASCKIIPGTDTVTVQGEKVVWRTAYYLMLNKPAGCVTATRDTFQRTVLDLLPERLQKAGIFPAGRLDKDTEGLLLLTSDGAFAHALMSPRRHVDKIYEAQIRGVTAPDTAARFAQGLTLEDGTVCRPAVFELLETGPAGCRARITLREGRFHQVKRMVRMAGGEVIALRRVRIGMLRLDPDLPLGGYRELTEQEKRELTGE